MGTRGEAADPVATCVLGRVKRLIGVLNDRFKIAVVVSRVGYPKADGDLQRLLSE